MKHLNSVAIIVLALFLFSCGGSDKIEDLSLYPVSDGDQYQFINTDGETEINPQFTEASVFRNGLALVGVPKDSAGTESLWGFIDESGEFVIDANYVNATSFREDIAWVVAENGVPTAINTKGETLFSLEQAQQVMNFFDGLAAFAIYDEKGNARYGFVNEEGEEVISPQYADIIKFSDGYCAVQNDEGEWGYIDEEGNVVIKYQFDDAFSFQGKTAIVASDDQHGVINTDGKYIINPQFNDMEKDGDLYLINKNGEYGWCDDEGNMVINPQFASAKPFLGNDLAPAISGGEFGYVDKEGSLEINPQFDKAFSFNNGIALVSSGNKYGLIDEDGEYVVNPQFQDIPQDLMAYLRVGYSLHQFANTDYFNKDLITELIIGDSFHGINNNSIFAEVTEKFDMSENNFSYYRKYAYPIRNRNLSHDIEYDFYVWGRPYKKVRKKNKYGYTTTQRVFDKSVKPVGVGYNFDIEGDSDEKKDKTIKALEEELKNNNYTFVEESSNDEKRVYKNTNYQIRITNERDLKIFIKFLDDKETETT